MPKTITSLGIEKIGRRFADSVDHAAYTLNGAPKTVAPFRKIVEAESVKIYIYFDDTISGNVANVQLVDADGDVVAQSDREFEKPPSKGLYVAFKYTIIEKETEVQIEVNSYEKIGWLDHVEDVATGEVIQEGTPVSQTNMNHMDEGIYQNREAVILHEAQIADAQKEIKVLKDATLNNMTNNVFLINFDSVNSVAITSGIYDPVARKLYV